MATFQIDTNYEPSPEFSAYKPRSEAPNWLLTTYYVGFMFYAMVAIVVSVGVIYNKQKCTNYANGSETGAIVFEVFGYITAILSVCVLCMSIMALVFRMGFSEQILSVYRKLEPANFDTEFRINQLQSDNTGLVELQQSTLAKERARGVVPYGDLDL